MMDDDYCGEGEANRGKRMDGRK